MDIDYTSKLTTKKQEKVREYYDVQAPLKKRPYHYFAKTNRPLYTSKYPEKTKDEISKKLSKAWKKLEFKQYIKYVECVTKGKKTILTNKGFELYKTMYPDTFLQEMRKDLTVKPRVAKGYGMEPEPYEIFTETSDKLIIPKYYGYKKLKNYQNIENKISMGDPINLKFNGELRENQLDVIDTFKKVFKTKNGGLIVARCAFGKTAVATYVVTMLQRKTLVIVHKQNLLLQWHERIAQFLPDAKIGKIQGSVIDVEGKDIVIGMIQSLCKKDYGDLFKQFGLLICDEAHRTGAKEFCNALRKAATYYTLGLTATPTRNDGLTKVFKWYLGETEYVYNKITEFDVTVKAVYYASDSYQEKKLYSGGFNFANMISQIVDETKRTDMIVDMARDMAKSGRQVLIIGHRLKMLRSLHKLIKEKNTLKDVVTSGFYIGGMKEVALLETTKQNIILGSFSMIEEGADIPSLDSIILATPKSTVQQAVGRIMRKQNKHNPLIIDIIDDFSIFVNQAEKRKKYYVKEKYTLTGYRKEQPRIENIMITERCLFDSDSD
jgi:superfamily II DNA or RNA helicase